MEKCYLFAMPSAPQIRNQALGIENISAAQET
jgi:hypothetical protein